MKALPYFRWYPADAETDAAYAAMNWAERGFFHWCLNYSWINDGLPLELAELARAARMSLRELNRLWERVGKSFTSESGSWRNARQEEERAHATTKSERNAASVRTRYERSYERATNVPTNVLQHAQARADSDSVSASGSVSSEKGSGEKPTGPTARMTLSGMRWKSDEQYARFVADYLGTGAALIDADFADAYEFCWRTLDFSQKLARVSSLTRHAEEYHANPRFVPKPRKFLETEWERQVRPLPRGPRSSDSLADRTIALVQRRIANGDNPL